MKKTILKKHILLKLKCEIIGAAYLMVSHRDKSK